MTREKPAYLILGAVVLAVGCDAGGGAVGPDDDGGPDEEADAGTGTGAAEPGLSERLDGAWALERVTCDGDSPLAPYDDARVSLEFDGSRVALVLTAKTCVTRVPFDVRYDEARSSFVSEAVGVVGCVPEACSDVCGGEFPTPPLGGTVTFDGEERMAIASDGPDSILATVCQQAGLTLPAVQVFRRPDVPVAIDDAACDVDPFGPGRTVYYVAQNEPSADNDACDGRAPTDEGAGHCPFRDFSSVDVRRKLFANEAGGLYVRGVTVAVREGTYGIEPLDAGPEALAIPLRISSDARSPAQAVVLTRYEDETVVLDGTCPATTPTCDSPEDPGRIWSLLSLIGRFIVVRGLTFDQAHKWNITVMADDVCITENTLVGPYGSDSDSIKSFEASGPGVIVRANEFHTGFEQAIDGTMGIGWLIEDNDVHDGMDRGVGFKLDAQDSIVRGNRFWNLPGTAISLGGTSASHVFPEEGLRLVAEGNTVWNVGGLVDLFSCVDCAVRDNVIDGARLGIDIRNDEEVSGCAGGCAPISGLALEGNRLRNLTGDDPPVPEGAPANVFVIHRGPLSEGFAAAHNLYCTLPTAPALFAIGESTTDFAGWLESTDTDETSSVVPSTSDECGGAWH